MEVNKASLIDLKVRRHGQTEDGKELSKTFCETELKRWLQKAKSLL